MIELRGPGGATLAEVAGVAADGETPWVTLEGPGEHVFTADVIDEGSAAGTFTVEGRRQYQDGTTGATRTLLVRTAPADFPQVGRLSGWWQVRLRFARSAGTVTLAITQ